MFEGLIYNFGYFGIFIVAFLASTILPFSSEAVVILAVALNYNVWLVFLFALLGNYFGALTNYFIGKYGNKFILSKYIKVSLKKRKKAEEIYLKWGSPTLFFSWVPVIGDPLCIIPGIFNLSIRTFSFWVILGKAFRYFLIIKIARLFLS